MSINMLRNAFSESLNLPPESITDDLKYATIKEWDSVAHMALIANIEKTFDILIETEDIIDMSSFAKAREIVTKYGVTF